MNITLEVKGMTCGNCVKHVREALLAIAGVQTADVNLETGTAVVSGDNISDASLIEAISDQGYEAQRVE